MIDLKMSDDGTEVVVAVNGRKDRLTGAQAVRVGRVLKRMGAQAQTTYKRKTRTMDADESRAVIVIKNGTVCNETDCFGE